jgi:peptidyl-prolyl cis-trans isomerase A (cyclophilin A)
MHKIKPVPRLIVFLTLLLMLGSCEQPNSKYPVVTIHTEDGDIDVELYNDKAPQSAGTFLTNAKEGAYDNSTFYRVLNRDNQPSDASKAELIQGGLWRTNLAKAKSYKGIPHEPTNKTGVLHKDGTISFARTDPGTATTEFFICIGDQPGFDFGGENNPDGQGYAAFGKVIKGMDVVRKIYQRNEYDQRFNPPVHIYDIHPK